MIPIPTRTAATLFLATLTCLLLGAFAGSLAAAAIGATGLVGLATALAATMPIGRRVRRQRLEFAWWLAHGDPASSGGAVVPGAPFEVRCFLRHRGTDALLLGEIEPIAPGGVRSVDGEPTALALAPTARTEFSFRMVAPAIGRVVLHGLAVTLRGPLGLFAVPLYFPNPLVIKVLPPSAARIGARARAVPGLPVERSGRSILAPHGGGTELRELREMRPGDPFKSIAWKHSARRVAPGPLGTSRMRFLVREVEQEMQETRYVVLDVSGTMRGGEPGHRKLDHAIEAVAAEARRCLSAGDRVGVITVDGRVVAHVEPQDGQAHLLRVVGALLDATEIVDEDLTDVDDDEVCAIVGRYVRQQDGVDFSSATSRGVEWNLSMLVRHVQKALATEQGREEKVLASTPATATLRRFCRVRGIPLPYRPDPRDGTKGPGLAAALQQVAARSLGPLSIVVLSDLDGLGDPEVALAPVRLLRRRGHDVSFVVHHGPSFARPPVTPLEKDIFEVYARVERRRVLDLRARLLPLGTPLTLAHASDPPAALLGRSRSRLAPARAALPA